MQYNPLGNTGLIVSRLSLGAMTFNSGNSGNPAYYKVDEAVADGIVGQAIDAGVNFFDTADVYAGGESEEVLGRVLGARRKDMIITTKVGSRVGKNLNEAGLSRRHIMVSVDASLKRLGTEWIDLYVVHRDDPYTPMEETLTALDAVVRAGKVRYLGFSNWSAWRATAAMDMMRTNGLAPFTHGQMHYSLLGRDIEHDVIPMMQQYGLGLTVWSPLAGGFLSGKYRRDQAMAEDSRYALVDMLPIDRELAYDLAELMEPIAAAHGASIAQIAIAWLLAKRAVSSVILGAAKPSQLADNLGAGAVVLSAEEVTALDEASAIRQPYPAWFEGAIGDRKLASVLGARQSARR